MTFPRAVRLTLTGQLECQHSAADETNLTAISGTSNLEEARAEVEALLKESLGAVYRYCLRLTRDPEQALDLTQETMLKAWRSRQMLASPQSARPWLLKIASNCWNDHLRGKLRKEQLREVPLLDPPPCRLLVPDIQLEQQEAVRQALAALDQLPERQRQVMYLVTVEQLPQTEVAYILQISPAAVKANLSAARKQLREKLKTIYQQFCESRTCRTNQ